MGDRLLAIGYGVTCYRLIVIGYRDKRAKGKGRWILGYRPWAMGYGVTCYRLSVISCQVAVVGFLHPQAVLLFINTAFIPINIPHHAFRYPQEQSDRCRHPALFQK